MRTLFIPLALLPWIGAIAQEGAVAQVAEQRIPDTARVRVSRWAGSGGKFMLGQPIEPMAMRAITWEFGDGSLSHIMPPRPWIPSDAMTAPSVCMAPFRERNGGSACVAVCQTWPCDDRPGEPRPLVISETGQPVLITTGLDACYLQVRMLDPVGRDGVPAVDQHFVSGRWALDGAKDPRRPLFITLQDLSTGERWRAGVEL